eukprot:gene11164-12337_t
MLSSLSPARLALASTYGHQTKQQQQDTNRVNTLVMEKTQHRGIFRLKCAVQNYAWGKIGENSIVANLATCDREFKVEDEQPYAELWMGTHVKGASQIAHENETGKSLRDILINHPELVGEAVHKKYGGQLPFLFKVLSVNKSLSIQAHPSKDHAVNLHTAFPEIYPDPNHKPELAIALTRFEALCGFRPASQVLNYLHEVPEFLAVVGQPAADQLINAEHVHSGKEKEQKVASALKRCLSCVMNCDTKTVAKQLKKLVTRLEDGHLNREDTTPYLGRLFMRIYNEFPGDVGCFVIYFLNHVILKPGEAIYLAPNNPHAYLSGDCIECMACSDNVVRAGLTPKFKDVATLCDMLDYRPKTPQQTKFNGVKSNHDSYVHTYNPPVDEFAVDRVLLPEATTNYCLAPINGPSIVLTISGKALASNASGENGDDVINMNSGTVLFIGANECLKINEVDEELHLYRAYCDLQT